MTPERARELLGGLAAGILTPEERQTLFEAALHDQALFNEVADELEFAVFLQSADTRAQLANRIEVEPERRRWWAMRPAWLCLVVAASIALLVAIRHRPGEVTQVSVPAPSAPAVSSPQAANESAGKEPAPVVSKVAPKAAPTAIPGPKLARIAPAAPGPQPAAAPEPAKDSVTENRLEARDKGLPEQAATRSRAVMAAPMLPQAAPPSPPPLPATAATAGQQAESQGLAQAFTGLAPRASLTGTVHDPSGAPVPGAKVDIVNNSTSSTTHMVADSNGRFVALSLPQGPYTVIANGPGFIAERRSFTLQPNQPAQIDIPLRIGMIADSVNVTAAAPSLAAGQNLTQVAVLDFANGNQQNPSGAQVADQLSSQLLNSGQLRVIDREKVQQAAQSRNTTGRPPNAQEAAALGRSIGADAVIVGSVQAPAGVLGSDGAFAKRKAASNVSMMAEIIDTKQARPPVKLSADAASLQGATNILGDKIQSQLAKPVEGKVTNRTGDIVSVAFAESPGLEIGARCEVIRGTQKIGELVITSVNGLSAFGKFSGTSQPRPGDRVTSSR